MKKGKAKPSLLFGYLCLLPRLRADRPVTYLYNTLHYYERHLRDRTNLKRKLVHAIMSSLKVGREDAHTHSWICTVNTFLKYI